MFNFSTLMEQEHFGRCYKCVNISKEELCSGSCNLMNHERLEVGGSSFVTLLLKKQLEPHVFADHVTVLTRVQTLNSGLKDRQAGEFVPLNPHLLFLLQPLLIKEAWLRPLTVHLTKI